MLKMGLGLMAGKSPNALTNVGEAGIGALQMTMAEKKAAAEQAKMQAETEYMQQHGAYFAAMPDIKAAQLDAKQRISAEQILGPQLKAIDANLALTPMEKESKKAAIRSQVYDTILLRSGAAPAAPAAAPSGVTVRQIG